MSTKKNPMNKNNNKFVEREFAEVEGGYYDNDFYFTPNGSKCF